MVDNGLIITVNSMMWGREGVCTILLLMSSCPWDTNLH